MIKRKLTAVSVMAMFALGLCSPYAMAADAAYTAEFVNAQGETIVVTTFTDGNVSATIGGNTLTGEDALAALSSQGIVMRVGSEGQLVVTRVRNNIQVKVQPTKAIATSSAETTKTKQNVSTKGTPKSEQPVTTAQTTTFSAPLPAPVAGGSSSVVQSFQAVTGQSASDVQGVSVSGK